MTTATLDEARAPVRGQARWPIAALAGICVLAGALYAWRIAGGQVGNAYYSAAVKSMTHDFSNFLFGSLDQLGMITVDKPPMALWPQVISVWLFGYHGWALLLPQVIEGVAAVFLFHRTVRRWAGENVALLAALIFALTPVTVAINRYNNPDTLLVLLLVAAAYALTRAIQDPVARGRTKWLLWCAFFVGCGFLTKMLQAWIVLPAFALTYVVATDGPVKRKAADLLGATLVLVVSSFWWVALHDWWPGRKPVVGGSEDGSAWDLAVGYNGLGRIFGKKDGSQGGPVTAGPPPGAAPAPGGGPAPELAVGGNPLQAGDIGLGRMFSEQVGGQIAWLLPLSLLTLLVVAVLGVHRLRTRQPGRPEERGGWYLWSGWLLVTLLVFSFAKGIWHEYYTTMLAPPIAAVSAAGIALLWQRHREPGPLGWLLPVALAGTAAWAFVLVSREPSWHGWARWAVLVVAAVAVAGLLAARLGLHAAARPAVIAGIVAVLLTPAVWSVAAALDRVGGMPAAGPRTGSNRVQQLPGGGVIMTGGGSGGAADSASKLTPEQERILDYARKHNDGAEITLAANSSTTAAPYIINSDAVVLAMGGFQGGDNTPSTDQLREWVREGKLRFVLGAPPAQKAGQGGAQLGPGMSGRGRDRQQWVEQNCKLVDPKLYGGAEGKQQRNQMVATALYDCG